MTFPFFLCMSIYIYIYRLKIWREMFVIPNTNPNEEQPSDLEETINDYNYNNPNDSQHYIPEQYEVSNLI